MNEMLNARFQKLGFSPADILLPKNNIDMTRWAVVACDQFTSQPEYWRSVEKTVGDAPSALNLILPEARLRAPDVDRHIKNINQVMENDLKENIFDLFPDSVIYLERVQSDGKIRHGLIGKIDLEDYDFTPGNGALIRATEGTVLSRIPPRVKVREHAAIEISHVMLLIDDPEDKLLAPFRDGNQMKLLYQFPLRWGGGSVKGWKLTDAQISHVADALEFLRDPDEQARKYGLDNNNNPDGEDISPLLFAVGDGNHSLATAKQCYENLKKITPESEWKLLPARYALVEIVNLHDDALRFEPIHRHVSNINPEKLIDAFLRFYPDAYFEDYLDQNPDNQDMNGRNAHRIKLIYAGQERVFVIPNPTAQLAVGTLQAFLDDYTAKNGGEIDYIHGDDVVRDLSKQPDSMGFLLPAMGKDQLFRTVIKDGVLPRKTFSMGHARDKRYYIEARKIR